MYFCGLVIENRQLYFNCLGQAEDQICAGPLSVLLCVQLGYGSDSERVFKSLKSPMISILQDPSAKVSTRSSVSLTKTTLFDRLYIVRRCCRGVSVPVK